MNSPHVSTVGETLGRVVVPGDGRRVLTYRALFASSEFLVLWTADAVTTAAATASSLALALQALPELGTPARLLLAVASAYVVSLGSGARWGLLAEIVPVPAFPLARSTMNVAVGAFQVVGFAVGGLLLSAFTAGEVFVLAALVSAAALTVLRLGLTERPPRRTARAGLAETVRGNRLLLSRRGTRVLLVALCVPNGLVVGCEALFMP